MPVKDFKTLEQMELHELFRRRDENETERNSIFAEYEQYARRDKRMCRLDDEARRINIFLSRRGGPGAPFVPVFVQDTDPEEGSDAPDTNDIA